MYNLFIQGDTPKILNLSASYENILDGLDAILELHNKEPNGLYHLIKEGETHPNSTIASLKDNFVYDFERIPDEHINIFEKVSSTGKYRFIQIFVKPETEKISKLKYFAETTPTNKFNLISINTDGIWGETRKLVADLLFNSDSKLYLWCDRFKMDIHYDDINVQMQYPLYLYYQSGFDEKRNSENLFKIYEEEMSYYKIKYKDYFKKYNKI